MKKTSFLIALVLFAATLVAQPGTHHPNPPSRYNVDLKIRSRGGERFIVTVDGNRQVGGPVNAYTFSGLTRGRHNLTVELTKPAHATVRTTVDLQAPEEEYMVVWRTSTHGTELVVEPANMATFVPGTGRNYQPPSTIVPPTGRTGGFREGYQEGYRDGWRDAINSLIPRPVEIIDHTAVAVEAIPVATPSEVAQLVSQLKSESFDNNRAELAQAMVVSKLFTTADIKRMLATFTFEDNKLDFAKFAYTYVADPENYPQVSSVFTFSSNKTELLNHIKRHLR